MTSDKNADYMIRLQYGALLSGSTHFPALSDGFVELLLHDQYALKWFDEILYQATTLNGLFLQTYVLEHHLNKNTTLLGTTDLQLRALVIGFGLK